MIVCSLDHVKVSFNAIFLFLFSTPSLTSKRITLTSVQFNTVKRWLPFLLVISLTADPATASLDPYADETEAEKDARMAWWREARFGMFIHWGVYAVPAGVYQGEQIPGIGEWIMSTRIPVDEYKAYAQEFNPVDYDPAEWAALAKEAGMRYMVITSKHHDGFALYQPDVLWWDTPETITQGQADQFAALLQLHRLKKTSIRSMWRMRLRRFPVTGSKR